MVEVLERIGREVGFPAAIRVDQGSEFVSRDLDLWAYQRGVTHDFSRPGKPTDNAYVESFNATVRLECLGRHWFLDLDDACQKVEEWRTEYNEVRPHSAIGDRDAVIFNPSASATCRGAHKTGGFSAKPIELLGCAQPNAKLQSPPDKSSGQRHVRW